MTSKITDMFKQDGPFVIVEEWTSFDGWPCYRVSLVTDGDMEPAWDGIEHLNRRAASIAAAIQSNNLGGCPIHYIERGG